MSQSVKPTRGYTGWLLSPQSRELLLKEFEPSYPRVLAHHCTLKYGTTSNNPNLPTSTSGTVIGIANDDSGVEALVLRIDGTHQRWDGSTYHITWSLSEDRKPVDSNAVIKSQGWTPVPAIEIELEPKFFPMGK